MHSGVRDLTLGCLKDYARTTGANRNSSETDCDAGDQYKLQSSPVNTFTARVVMSVASYP